MLSIHYFASVREELGRDSDELVLPGGVRDVRGLVGHLVADRGGNWTLLQDESRILVAVDQTIVDRNHPLSGEEEVAFFPPMTGG